MEKKKNICFRIPIDLLKKIEEERENPSFVYDNTTLSGTIIILLKLGLEKSSEYKQIFENCDAGEKNG